MTNTEVATITEPRREIPSQYRLWSMADRAAYARMLAGAAELVPSGLRGGSVDGTAAKIFIATETGDMLGLHPMAAIGGIDIIEGQPTVSPQLALGLIRKAGHKPRIIETGTVEDGDLKCVVTLIRGDDPDDVITKSYTLHDAARAGLCTYALDPQTGKWVVTARSRAGNPLNWEKYPADMCQWRAVGRLMRAGAGDVLLGVSYFPEELEALVDESGVRTEAIGEDEQNEYIDRIKALDDKADMETIWQEINRAEKWTTKLMAEFDAHLSTLTKDSRPPKDGAPGHTGDPEIDDRMKQVTTGTEPPESGANTPPRAQTGTPPVPDAPSEAHSDDPVPPLTDADAPAQYATGGTVDPNALPIADDGMIPPGAAMKAARAGFNPSALQGKTDQ